MTFSTLAMILVAVVAISDMGETDRPAGGASAGGGFRSAGRPAVLRACRGLAVVAGELLQELLHLAAFAPLALLQRLKGAHDRRAEVAVPGVPLDRAADPA